jgi:hypothetical protein
MARDAIVEHIDEPAARIDALRRLADASETLPETLCHRGIAIR